MSERDKAIETACNAYLDGKFNQSVLFVDMRRAVVAFLREVNPSLEVRHLTEVYGLADGLKELANELERHD